MENELTFDDFKLTGPLQRALEACTYVTPTPIQAESFSIIMSGKDVAGLSQTGTGKTLAYLLPILQSLKYVPIPTTRVIIVVPTQELVIQVVDEIKRLTEFISIITIGVYGGPNINTQADQLADGVDIVVATPVRLFDLIARRAIVVKNVKKLVVDEADLMLDLGFREQLKNVFDVLPEKRQHIFYSATMTEEVDDLIEDFLIEPKRIRIAISGTPLKNIQQTGYPVHNFNTKLNLLEHLLATKEEMTRVLIFVVTKKLADRVTNVLEERLGENVAVVHSNKSANIRRETVESFTNGEVRILVATDVIARGLDVDEVTHVISMDTPKYPENYIHRIGRTGRAKAEGESILLFTEKEVDAKLAIEELMKLKITQLDFPEEVEINPQLTEEERPRINEGRNRSTRIGKQNAGFHDKSKKNSKVNLGSKYWREKGLKYKKPKTKGDKNYNKNKPK